MEQSAVLPQTIREVGDPGPTLNFLFTMLAACFWGMFAGIFNGPASIPVGLVQLGCFIPYTICAVFYFMRNETMNGSIFMIFSALFCGVGGLMNVGLGICEIMGHPISAEVSGIPYLWGSIVLIPLIISVRKVVSLASILCFIGAFSFLLLLALITLGVLPSSVNVAVKWLLIFVSVDGLYTVVNALLAHGGCKLLPEGKPLFK